MAKLSDEITKELDKITLVGILDRQGFDGVATMIIERCYDNAKSAENEDDKYTWLSMAGELESFVVWSYDL